MNHKARKRFGQNFLQDEVLINKIVDVIKPSPKDNLIEIGPGQGALTFPLLERCKKMTAVELDRDLVQFLEQMTERSQLTVISQDVLTVDFNQFEGQLRLVGNLPYNISTPIMLHLLQSGFDIKDMHFMLQLEVVERLGAVPNTKAYGRLSVMVQYHCRVMPLIPVPPSAFRPAPKVQSAIVRLKPHKTKPCTAFDEDLLSQIVSFSFQQRRKTLRNCLQHYADHLGTLGDIIDLSKRPEQLSVAEFVKIANHIHNNMVGSK